MTSSFNNQINYSGKGVTAVLGPTNTGKTHLALERMVAHETGIIGLPLRLLAREVYDRLIKKVPADQVALITGEEKIKPPSPRYWVATVEAMPRDLEVEFVAIDEAQLAEDRERGHIFTNRILHMRGTKETLLLGSQSLTNILQGLLPGINFVTRPRLSRLTYAGEKKISRLKRRSAIVAFSARDVYAIAELVRRQRGGAAVVMGALSPRTRNAQVALYQNGDVDFLVATDAIGMGLNLDIDHVAFAAKRKFDGQQHRLLYPGELAQIAGRAGRHMNDGTFGVTAGVPPFDADLVEALESHDFKPIKLLQWRGQKLDFSTAENLRKSLMQAPSHPSLVRAPSSDDFLALETLMRDLAIINGLKSEADVRRLWSVCQLPDYRKISPNAHGELVSKLYQFLISNNGHVPEDWLAEEVEKCGKSDGDIDTLANRISHIRSWTFVANQADWVKDPLYWQGKTKEIEEQLSDALHERLTKRFVDTRTSTLVRSLADGEELNAELDDKGVILVEGHEVGQIKGFTFTPISRADNLGGKAVRSAAYKVLSAQLGERVDDFLKADDKTIRLDKSGVFFWNDEKIAYLTAAEHILKPQINLWTDEHVGALEREKITKKLAAWFDAQREEKLASLVAMEQDDAITGLAKGIAFRLIENLGVVPRDEIRAELKQLDQPQRALLRKHKVRFGAFHVFIPFLLKPANSAFIQTLWTINDRQKRKELYSSSHLEGPKDGLTCTQLKEKLPQGFLRAAGYQKCGSYIVRIDILERLSQQIRVLTSYRSETAVKADDKPADKRNKVKSDEVISAENLEEKEIKKEGVEQKEPAAEMAAPVGATGDGGFIIQPDMMAILGCTPQALCEILSVLGFYSKQQEGAGAQAKPEQEENAVKEAKDAKQDKETKETKDHKETAEIDYRTLIWRPKRRKPTGHSAKQTSGKKGKAAHFKNKKNRHKTNKTSGDFQKRPPRKDKPIDPDSPFASLQALKDKMATGTKK